MGVIRLLLYLDGLGVLHYGLALIIVRGDEDLGAGEGGDLVLGWGTLGGGGHDGLEVMCEKETGGGLKREGLVQFRSK